LAESLIKGKTFKGKIERSSTGEGEISKVIDGVAEKVKGSKAGEGEDVVGSVKAMKEMGVDATSGSEGASKGITGKNVTDQTGNLTVNNLVPDGKSLNQALNLGGGGKIIISIDKEGVPFVKEMKGIAADLVQLESALFGGGSQPTRK
jgi:hypothetical protein